MVIPMPTHAIFNPAMLEAEVDEYVNDFRVNFKMLVRGTFLEAQRDSWFLHVVTPWLLSLIPNGWTDEEFAERLGTDRAQPWRYRNDGQVPSDKVVYQWLRPLGLSYSDMPRISQQVIYPAFGIAANAERFKWKTAADHLPVLQKQRNPLPSISASNIAICYALISDTHLRERWKRIVWDYQPDITQALNVTELPRLLRDVLDFAFRILSVDYRAGSILAAACDDLAAIDLSSEAGRVSFLSQLQSLWVPYHFHWFCVHECTHDLFFDVDYSR